MQNKRLFTTEMDFAAVDKPPIFLGTVKQLDGVTLKITPLSRYNPMTMIGVTPKLYAKKPNGEFVYQDVDIDVDLFTSQISIQCKNSIFSDVGTVEMEIELYDDDNYLITSPTFEIDVNQKLNQIEMEDLKEGIHISLLEELMDYVAESKDYVEKFKELLSEFGDDDTVMLENLIVVRMMLETLSSEVDRLENTIAQAQEYEFEMANQEIARVAAEEKRVEVEADRVQAENDRKEAESQREENEANRENNFNDIKEEFEAIKNNHNELVTTQTTKRVDEVIEPIADNKVKKYTEKVVNDLSNKVTEVDNKIEEVEEFIENKNSIISNTITNANNKVDEAISKIPPKSELIGPKGDKGDKGEQGIQGVDGLTPNITIGNVATLEPNQQATVIRRGTDTNPIFDFGIPKGEKGEGGTNSSSGTDSVGMKLLVEYTHTGNQEIHFSNINWATGEATTTIPHGLTGKTEILIAPNDWSLKNVTNNLTSVPIEWTINNNKITVVPNGSNGLFIRKNDGITVIPVDTNDVSNGAIDFTKFHFEIPVPFSFENFPKGVLNYRFVSRGYIKAGGQYRYTRHSYYDESGAIKESGYINFFGAPGIQNANSTHCVFGHQIWDIYADNGYIRVDSNSIFQGRRKGYTYIVFDRGFEKITTTLLNNFKPCGLANFWTYSKEYAYISNNSLIQIYDLGGR